MQRQNSNPYQQGALQQQQQQQQSQQFISQEQQQQYSQQVSSSTQQQQSFSRTERHVQRSQVTTQQRVQQHHGGTAIMQHQQMLPSLTHVYAQGDISPPVFEQIFRNARFAQGGNAMFEGKLRGNPKPFVTWTRKGAPLLESQKYRMNYNEVTGEVSLLINQIGPGDEGEYTCSARNQYGEAICSVFIQPEGMPMPVLQPIQTHDKSMYTNGYSFTSIEEEFRVDTFEYRLLREVSFRESITRRTQYESDFQLSTEVDRALGPAFAPQINTKPRNSKLVEGSDAVFTAKVGSNPRPRLTWFRNGQRIVPSSKHEISYSSNMATLRVKNANLQDAGHYTLLVENVQGCVVSSAVLAVEPATESSHEPKPVDVMAEQLEAGKALPPQFVKAFTDRQATEGRMTRFDCRVTGNPYPEVFWFINGQMINDDATHKILVNESGSHSLMITNVSRYDAGVVQCLARNKAGEVGIEAQLNVLEKEQVVAPQFVQRFQTITVREGEPVALSANAIGTPVPRITWQKDGVQISSTQDRFVGIDGGATCLEIPRAIPADAGWYQCTAQNVAGSTANRARLYVLETPRDQPQEQRRLQLPRPTKVIEPEPVPGPEIIYLRHVERAKPHLRPGEEDRVYPPPQFIIPLQNVQQTEGGRVHMEARIEPVGDPSMVVEWFLNGRPLAASSRATSVFKFGFIALDLITIIAQDSGEYVCRVTNATGMAESRAILTIVQRPSIEQRSQHPSSLQYISQLEDYSKYSRQESTEELMNQRPAFIKPLHDMGEFEEGKNIHFEAQLTPVNDPTMRVEWYKDGRPITASSRITAIFNFGYVSLNIMHLRAEDAGSYTVRAVNRVGEAISTSTIRVISRSQVTADLGIPEQQRYIEKVEELEQYQKSQQKKYVHEVQEPSGPPVFKTPIKDQIDMREGAYAHFEARLEPIGDSTMRVEWLKDGRPLEASSRSTTFFNFGYVALTIKQLTIYDAGVYTCRAYNSLGQATTSANLTVLSKKAIVSDSQHPGGMQKIQHLEDSSRYARNVEEETKITQIPRFLGPMKGTNKILEGQRAHFEARVEPQSDLSMQIEWYHNGQAITAANRISTYYDFGYVALDISAVRADDAGVYTVVARNKLGEAQLSATMVVETRSSIDTSSMHRGLAEKTRQLENQRFVEPHYDIEEISKSKPIFVQPLSDPKPMHEGKNIHLECRLEPMGDPTMRVEWFQNGRPITVGSRFRTYYDFGFVALDIVQTIAADSGEYTCRATNHLGSAHTSACVRIIDRSDVVTETQNEMSLEQIQLLEEASRRRHHVAEEITVMQAPQFTRPLHNIETMEGTNVHLECRLQPVGDPTMHVEWFVNGQPCKTGHRFRPAYEFDYVALDLLGVYAADSGVYTCQARNQLGEAVTSCSVRIIAKKDLVFETQNESGLQKIQYLEDSSRYKRSEYVDETINIRPRFLTHPKNLGHMREGAHAHFECKIEPVTDPNLKVEWFKNGRPITIGHRFRPIHDFGYVALDIVDLIAEDSGVYTCRAQNLVGCDETRCELICRSSEQIVTVTQNEAGLEQIHYLEDKTKYRRHEEIDETTKQAPVFTTSLKNIEIKENQRAHFECRLIPVSDPTMKVEWYHNNQPLKSGSRFTETNNFGFVALDIMSCLPEDAGTYTCRAHNAIGEAVTSAIALVHTKKAIYHESQHEGALHRLQYLEESSKRQKMSVQEEIITQAPVFTMPVRDVRVAENQAVHFEARLIPVGDPHLTVEWLHNGQPIEASNRVTTMHDFGYVALNMKYVNPEDSGTYTCRAVNELGQAVTSATLIVQSKAALQLETQNEAAMHKIHQLEDHTKYSRREEEEIEVTQPPRFITRLIGPTNLVEGQSAHYECRIEPYPDPNLKVEWFHNGKPLTTGHRFRNTYDFGFAALDVLTVYAEDSGEYTCRVTNNLGTAMSSINLNVQTKSSIIRETQHEEALEKIQYLEDTSRFQRKEDEDVYMAERPQFGRPLRNANVSEGRPVHLEATLTPVNDPTMKVEWYCNGIPIQTGHRFKTTYDFGFVALDILYAHAEDTGTYMCKAKNAVGEAVTTSAVNVTANATLVLDTMDEERLEKIRQLESYAPPKAKVVEEKGQKPVFLTPLTSLEHLKEGEHAHLECRVEPINDPNLKIEWFCNGKAIAIGHRFRTTHDFGYVALDILYAYGEDTGTYMCKATNLLGEAMNTCNVRVLNRRSMILDTQHPDALEKIQKLEAKAAPSRQEVDDLPISPPHFTVELRGNTEIYEGKTAHFEAQVQPMHDPNLRIEFYHNGKPLPSASRFHITFDFGYVALDITHAVAEDAGEYSVRAVNNLGQCTSSTSLRVIPFGGILSETQHPEGLEKIRQLESTAPFHRPEVEGPQTRQRPVFTQPLQNIDRINEAQTAHFEARLIPVGDPNLKVEWYRNEKLIEDSSRITKQHDFGYVSLDISHIRKEDEGVYMCRAVNPLGEAVTTASMRVVSEASIQMDTQHPESIGRIHQLERPTAPKPEEPERLFEKPIFTQLLTGPSELWEGQHAHFEARVVPVGDPTLRFEWYVNGVELQMGSRLRTTHDFGFVTLDISSVVKEDSGMYMCRAYNAAGEAVSSTGMKVKTKSSIAGEPLIPESWEAIRLKEAAMNRVPEMFVDTSPQQAPVFTTHLQSFDKLAEGQHVRLEAQVEPRADPNLRIEWFKNGISLTTGARIRSTFDFGLVNLSINGLRADDSGIYTCKATNLIGEAVSTSSIKVEDRHWLMADTLHPESLPRIDALEAPKEGRPDAPEPVYESPVFITHLNNIECKENESVRFECNVEPARDPTMSIEWFYNGNPLPAAAKFKSIYDFGYCALDLTSCYAENSGIYTCKATNSKGSATTSGTLKCTGEKSMFFETQHPQGPAGLQAVQETEEALANRSKPKDGKPETVYPAPVWTVPLSPEFKLSEGQPLHLEGNVEPKEDPNLFIEWYFNGKLLQHGSRFKMTSEFGFVTLDLIEVYERDQGMYTCKAYNRSGEAFTQTTVFCSSKESIIEKTQNPKGAEGLEQIQDLEESLRKDGTKPESPEDGQAPRFTTEFVSIVDIGEGEIAHFEANLVPTGDQSMVIEWFYNGKVLDAGHRFRTIYAFGMVALEVLGTKIEDSGTYTCRATNKWGTAEIHVELGCVDKPKGQKPRFTTHIQSLEGLKDGQSAHFECTLIPVNDPELKVEWYHNGKLLRHSNRIKPVSDFGYVLLDIAYLQDHDSGEYVCRAWNKYGEDFTRATLNCRGRGGVFSDTLQPDSLQRIRELECPQMGDQHGPTTPTGEPPKFITQISDATRLVEGQSAHFEARLTPITDPELVVEWYFNGKKLPHGHRFRTFHDFGIVILDILYCYEENSGVYECRAYNKYGEDVTRATLKCSSKASLILDSQLPRGMEGGLEKIQNLEYSMVRSRDETVEETRGKAPVFTVPLSNIDNLREGENAHFEARLTPTTDPKLKVEWYWNGKPLRAGSRFRTFCDFGFVILEISPVYPEDSGEFSCRAINEYGEAVTTATMKIQGKRSIIMESQLPKGMEGTIDRIAELEGLGVGRSEFVQEDDTGKPPEFVTTPFDMVITENSLAHFECRLQPINDQSMRVEWFHNGKALWAGSRIKTINDFGFVILEIAGCYQRDSGLYTCKATNKHGEASVSCKLQVRGRQGIIMEPQLPSNFRTGTESLQKLEESLHKREEIFIDEEQPNPPKFTEEIKDNLDVQEGGPIHFSCKVEPVGDPTMRIDWFFNGRSLATGSRVHMLNDFGFIALDIDYIYARDSGEYICRATNKWGTAQTVAKVTCKGRSNIVYDSQLPDSMTAEKLKELERGRIIEQPKQVEQTFGPPKFITEIASVMAEEAEAIRFECQVEPKEDPKLRIEWYHNGKMIPIGHRYRTVHDMGFVSLDILYVYSEDSGEYTCRAVNDFGEDRTVATISCKQQPSIVLQNQVPRGMHRNETITQMEAAIKRYTSEVHLTEDDLFDPDRKQPPRFVTQIKDQTKLTEMQSTKFECQLAPVGDPNMKVEWFFNGKPLLHKNRFMPIYDFGYVAMNFGWVYPEDSGEYVCRATNLYGKDETRAIIKTTGKPGIVYDSQVPSYMNSIERIREMEASWQVVPEEPDIDAKPRCAPTFVSKLEPQTVEEGEPARFCVRVTGHPRPRVMWLINGHTVVHGSRYKLTNDGMYHLDVPKTRQYDTGKVEVLARNAVGEAIATTELKVIARSDDYRSILKNSPRRLVGTRDYRKPEWVSHMEEMQKVLKAAKCSPTFVSEMRDCRAAIGESAKFEVQFSGNPHPDVQWYFDNVQLRDSDKYRIVIEENTSSLTILNIAETDRGYYVCKIINEVATNLTRAKFDICSVSQKTVETEKTKKLVTKKKIIKKTGGVKRQVRDSTHSTTVSVSPSPAREVTVEVIKVRQPVSVLVEKSEVSEVQIVKDRKEADAELEAEKLKIIKEEQTEVKTEDVKIEKEEVVQSTSSTTTTSTTIIKKTESVEITETVKIIREKISQKSITQEDVLVLKKHEEVNWILTSIEAETFGAGEAALRDLATIGLLLRYGCSTSEIIYMYEENIFVSLKKPESQSALVTLVERMGHDNLITIILSESSTEDESILAATVGFKAFIRMIETCEITIEEVIRKFVREDFIVQDWKISTKERVVETSQVIDSHRALTHIKVGIPVEVHKDFEISVIEEEAPVETVDEEYPEYVVDVKVFEETPEEPESIPIEVVEETPEEVKQVPTEPVKPKKKRKPSKKPEDDQDDIIKALLEQEVEKTVLEKYEKIDIEKPKKEKAKIEGLVPIKIERVEHKSQKMVVEAAEVPQTVKLRQTKRKEKPVEEDTSLLPKFKLKSRIVYVEFPPELLVPKYSEIGAIRAAGELSRNIEEAEELLKTKPKKFKKLKKIKDDREKVELEKYEKYVSSSEEETETKPYEKPEKVKAPEEPEQVVEIKLGKGKKKPIVEEQPESVTLKKTPIKPEEEEVVTEKVIKKKEEVVVKDIVEEPEQPQYKMEPFEPVDFEHPEYPKEELEEIEKPEMPKKDKKQEKPKHKRKEKQRPEQEMEQVQIVPGIPKDVEEQPEETVKFRIPESEAPEETTSEVKLKPVKKVEEEKPQEEAIVIPKEEEEAPKEQVETVEPEVKEEKPKKKSKKEKVKEVKPVEEEEKTFEVSVSEEAPVEETPVEKVKPKKVKVKETKPEEQPMTEVEVVTEVPEEQKQEPVYDSYEISVTETEAPEIPEEFKVKVTESQEKEVTFEEVVEEKTVTRRKKVKPEEKPEEFQVKLKEPVPEVSEIEEPTQEATFQIKKPVEDVPEEVEVEVKLTAPQPVEESEAEVVVKKKKPKKKPVEEAAAELEVKVEEIVETPAEVVEEIQVVEEEIPEVQPESYKFKITETEPEEQPQPVVEEEEEVVPVPEAVVEEVQEDFKTYEITTKEFAPEEKPQEPEEVPEVKVKKTKKDKVKPVVEEIQEVKVIEEVPEEVVKVEEPEAEEAVFQVKKKVPKEVPEEFEAQVVLTTPKEEEQPVAEAKIKQKKPKKPKVEEEAAELEVKVIEIEAQEKPEEEEKVVEIVEFVPEEPKKPSEEFKQVTVVETEPAPKEEPFYEVGIIEEDAPKVPEEEAPIQEVKIIDEDVREVQTEEIQEVKVVKKKPKKPAPKEEVPEVKFSVSKKEPEQPEEVEAEVVLSAPKPEEVEDVEIEVKEIKPKKPKPVEEESAMLEVKVIDIEPETIEEVVEEVKVVKKKPKKPVVEEVEEAPQEFKVKLTKEQEEEEVMEQAFTIKPKKKPVVQEDVEDVEAEFKLPVTKTVEEVTEDAQIKMKKPKKKVKDEAAAELKIKVVEEQPYEGPAEEIIVQEEEEEEAPYVVEEPEEEVVEHKIRVIDEEPQHIVEEIIEQPEQPEEKVKEEKLKLPKKKKPEVQVVEEPEAEVTLPQKKPAEEVTEEAEIKVKKPKKPKKEEAAADLKVTIVEEVPQAPQIEEVVEIEEIIEQPKEEEKKPEEIPKQYEIKVKESEPEEVPEEAQFKVKPKKVVQEEEEEVAEVKLKVAEKKVEEEEVEEKVVMKKKKPKKPVEETFEEASIKLIQPVEPEEEQIAEVTLKPKKPKEVQDEEVSVEMKLPKQKTEDMPEEALTLKKKRKPKPVEEAADELEIKQEVIIERPVEIEEEEIVEEAVFKRKQPKFKPTVEDHDEEEVSMSLKKPRQIDEGVEGEATVTKKRPVKPVQDAGEESAELVIRKLEEYEETDDVEEFIVSKKPKPMPKQITDIQDQEYTIKKLKRRKKSNVDIPEFTDVENVTFRARSTKTKEDVDQEFNIDLDSYAEEEISMSSKVKLKRPVKLTYSEAADEAQIKIIQDFDDGEEPIIEEIVDSSEGEDNTMYDVEEPEEFQVEELPPDEVEFKLKPKSKPKPRYSVQHEDGEEIMLAFKPKRHEDTVTFDEDSLTFHKKRKATQQIFNEEGASLNITREAEIEETTGEENVRYSICNYIADNDEAINLVEGEKVYVVGRHSSEWWFIRKNLTAEEGWVPAQYLMEPAAYSLYVQKKLHEKIDKLPVFEQAASGNAEPPLFVERFQEQSVPQKGTISLTAKVTGNPVPEVSWLFNNNPLEPSKRVQLRYDGEMIELTITDANPDTDSGDYKCIASNPVGNTSHGARVIVEVDEVKFTKKLKKNISIEETQSLTLECETSHVVSTKWFFNNKELSGMDHRVVVEDGKIHKLVIKTTNLRDAGNYVCKVKNQETQSTVEVLQRKPEFVRPLHDTEVKEKEDAYFEVEISTDAAEVTWLREGEKITPEQKRFEIVKEGKIRKLIIRESSIHDEGEIKCVLDDQECTAELIVIELPPQIIRKMEDVTVTKGESATFEIELTKGDALVKWFKNGKELQFSEHVQLSIDGKRQKLKIPKCELDDAAEYTCQVGDQKSKAKLVVEEPMVEFTVKLPDVTLATKSTDAEFVCELSQPDVEVTWCKKGKKITPNKKHDVYVEGTVRRLVIHEADDDDVGEISCTARNVTTTTKLCVEEMKTAPIIISDKEQTVKVKENDDVTMTVKFSGKPQPEATWSTSKTVIKKNKRTEPTIDEASATLTIRKVVEEDEDEYTVKLVNPVGDAEASIHLVIMRPPKAPGSPQPLEVMYDSITLYWKAPEDDGKSEIIEYILEYQDVKTQKWTEIRKIKDTTYTLTKLQIDSEYVFRSIAVNEIGPSPPSPLSPPIRLVAEKKTEKPTVQQPLQDITSELDKEVTLTCIFGGIPEPKITWKKNGKTIESTTIRYENRVSKYTIEKTTIETEATYTCVAENEVGSVETSCKIIIREKPTIEIDEKYIVQKLKTDSTLTIPARIRGYPKPQITWYKETTEITTTKRTVIETIETSSTVTITKLTREDSGRYKVTATNTAGTTSVDVTVQVIDKPQRPNSLEIKEMKKDSIKLEWTPPIDDGGLEVTKYILEKCDIQNNVWMKVAEMDKSMCSYSVQKLAMNSQYMFRVYASNPIGVSEPTESEPVTIAKKMDKPTPPREPLDVCGMTETSFTLSWEPSESDGGSKIIEYIVEIKEIHETEFRLLGSSNGNVTNIFVSNVVKDKAYNFRIFAKNEIGVSEALETEDKIIVGRRITPPSPPQNLRAPDVTSRSVTLDWEVPVTNGGSEITGYVIEKRSSTSTKWTKVVTLDAHCLQYTVENLKEKCEYTFRVFSENSVGLSIPATTDTISLKTHATVPSPPTGPLEARVIAANAHIFEWGIPESDGGAPLLGYNIAIRDLRKTMWIEVGRVPPDLQRFQIRDLQENHEYMIRIFARNEIGLSEPLESEEPYKVITTGHEMLPDEPRTEMTGMSTDNTSSWLRDHNMDADIHSYARAKLLRKDEYFFRIFANAGKLSKK